MSTQEVYLLLGSNAGNPRSNIENACKLVELNCGVILKYSSFYETEAWGIKEQPAFLNLAVKMLTTLTPEMLLHILKDIEKETGRKETVRWGPREIDIDILFYGSETVDLPQLQIPHPYIHQRRFTLEPLCEVAPLFEHPVLKKNIRELLAECGDEGGVKKL